MAGIPTLAQMPTGQRKKPIDKSDDEILQRIADKEQRKKIQADDACPAKQPVKDQGVARLNILLPQEQCKQLKVLASRDNQSINDVIRSAITDYLDKM